MIQLISLAELFAANPPAESVLKSYSDFMRAEGTGITGTPLIDLTVNSSSPLRHGKFMKEEYVLKNILSNRLGSEDYS